MSRHYLISGGEKLSEPTSIQRGMGPKKPVYTYNDSRIRLQPELYAAIQNLPIDTALAPNDVHVMQFVLHPSYLAKSYHPKALLEMAKLTLVGSKPVRITPEAGPDNHQERLSSALLVAGKRESFKDFDSLLRQPNPSDNEYPGIEDIKKDITKIERIGNYGLKDKFHPAPDNNGWYELVLHLLDEELAPFNLDGFVSLAKRLNVKIYDKTNFQSRDLMYLPVHGKLNAVKSLAEYSSVRAVRPMPRLQLEPMENVTRQLNRSVVLPTPPRDAQTQIRIAVLDGGLPTSNPINPWIEKYIEVDHNASDEPQYMRHGLGVCSALLFGNLESTVISPLHTKITVVRVLDSNTKYDDPIALYKTLGKIEDVLKSDSFDYINLSLGPDVPIEDDDVSAWTAVLDSTLSERDALLSVAVGNNGEKDTKSGNSRIEPPGDAVNALCVGAANSEGTDWQRASYSAIGPGRSPGIVKPDVLAFGGAPNSEFMILMPDVQPVITGTMGTSFAAPNALRQAIRIREICGPEISPLVAKTLLIHSAENHQCADQKEVGWGRIPSDATKIVTTEDGNATIIYRGRIKPGKMVRARIPVPSDLKKCTMSISATFSFKCKVDPQSPDVYTRSALEVTFRSDVNNVPQGKTTAQSSPFFSVKDTANLYSTETEKRSDQGKWETVLHSEKRYKTTTLGEPVFDIHYNAREVGASSGDRDELEYALAITLSAPKIQNLHELILDQYKQLVPLEPVLGIEGGLT